MIAARCSFCYYIRRGGGYTMSFQIIGDSCMDLTAAMEQDSAHFRTIPLRLEVGGTTITDDKRFQQADFLRRVKASPDCPKTACPSPEDFLHAFEEGPENLFVITLSEHLSGTFNAACIAKTLFEEKYGTGSKNIAVIGSDSGCAGETRLGLLCFDLCQSGVSFAETQERLRAYVPKLQTFFVLEDLSTLRKNGRLSGTAAFFATALNIKPVLYAVGGEIRKFDQARGVERALRRMCAAAVEHAKKAGTLHGSFHGSFHDPKHDLLPADRIKNRTALPLRAVIAHCNAPDRAAFVREELLRLAPFDEIDIAPTHGVSTVYASDGGIVVAI